MHLEPDLSGTCVSSTNFYYLTGIVFLFMCNLEIKKKIWSSKILMEKKSQIKVLTSYCVYCLILILSENTTVSLSVPGKRVMCTLGQFSDITICICLNINLHKYILVSCFYTLYCVFMSPPKKYDEIPTTLTKCCPSLMLMQNYD